MKNNIHFYHTYRSILLRMRNVSDKRFNPYLANVEKMVS